MKIATPRRGILVLSGTIAFHLGTLNRVPSQEVSMSVHCAALTQRHRLGLPVLKAGKSDHGVGDFVLCSHMAEGHEREEKAGLMTLLKGP